MRQLLPFSLLALVSVLLLVGCQDGPERSPAMVAENDRGVGLMGQFKYAEARDVFADVVAAEPEWLRAQVNLAIATLNRQQEGDEASALEIASGVLAVDPNHLDAHYVIGLLQFNAGNCVLARPHFEAVAAGDEADAYARYFLAQCVVQEGDYAHGLELYRAAIELDPYLRSAYYGAFQALQRTGDMAQARQMLEAYQRLDQNPRARLAEIKYTKMGPRAEARVAQASAVSEVAFDPAGPLLEEPEPLWSDSGVPLVGGYLAYPGGARLIASGASDDTPAVLRRETDAGDWVVIDVPLLDNASTFAFGDFDNDGRTDLYHASAVEQRLLRQTESGDWAAVTLPEGAIGSADAFWVDADHDGDLDLVAISNEGSLELYNNNRDGSFRLLAADHLPLESSDIAGAVASDLDGDRDLDLVVLYRDRSPQLLTNDRLWAYAASDLPTAEPWLTATVLDLGNDGRMGPCWRYRFRRFGPLVAGRRRCGRRDDRIAHHGAWTGCA